MMLAFVQAIVANTYPGWAIDVLKVWAGGSAATIISLVIYIWKRQGEVDVLTARVSSLERTVDGHQGKGGLQANVRGLRKAVRWSTTTLKAIAIKMEIDTEDMPDTEDDE